MPETAISVVIASYNRAHLVGRAIDSALAAMSVGDELIVADDGSTDGTKVVVSRYPERVRYLGLPHRGAAAARNAGVREARNPLVALLDDDDEWMPDKLQLQRAVMQARPDALFCSSDFTVRNRLGLVYEHYLVRWTHDARCWDEILGPGMPFSSIAPLPAGRPDFTVHVGNLYAAMLEAPYLFTTSMVIRRKAAGEALYFPEDLPMYMDWECFARLAKAGLAAHLDCDTAIQHGHAGARMTAADDNVRSTDRIVMTQRLWGADPEFMDRHGDRVREVLTEQHLILARGLMRKGRTREAREELRRALGGPRLLRIASRMPGPLVRGLVGLRDALRWGAKRLHGGSRPEES